MKYTLKPEFKNFSKKECLLSWADALESGEYIQGRGNWRGEDGKGHCCLNVAMVHFSGDSVSESGTGEGPEAIEFLGPLISDNCLFWQSHYVKMNDVLKYSFEQIAKDIRDTASYLS